VAEIELDYVVPAPDLADYVTLFYDFSANVPVFEDVERADHAQLRFRLSAGRGGYCFADGTEQDAPAIHLIGPTSGATCVRAEGPVALFGLGLTAAGWAAIVGVDASTMLNRVIDAELVFGTGALAGVAAALPLAEGLPARAKLVEALIRDRIRSSVRPAPFVQHVEAWLAAAPSPEMACLIGATGLSRRQIERKCNALYGFPPKLLARKYRALRAAVALVAGEETVNDAVDRGFYDQSHMIREIKHFTGLTPRQICAEPSVLARLTISGRRALDGVICPLVSGT
jgi:AraC-like DNA-binding protein